MFMAPHTEPKAPAPSKKKTVPPKRRAKGSSADREVRRALPYLKPLPVHGPDSALIAAYNGYLLAYSEYLVEADDADISISDALGRKILEMPCHTSEGLLLKINLAAAICGETVGSFPWSGKDFRWDTKTHSTTNQIEYAVLPILRNDIRRQMAQTSGISDDLANLIRVWREKERIALDAMIAADATSAGEKEVYERDRAIQDAFAMRSAVVNHRSISMADVMAKFELADPGEADFVALMNDKSASTTQQVMWSIAGDMERLRYHPGQKPSQADEDCEASALACRFRECIDRFDEIDLRRDPMESLGEKQTKLQVLMQKQESIGQAASFVSARSIRGALFQLVYASSLAELVSRHAKDEERDNAEAINRDIYRLIYSAAKAIAFAAGIPETDYAGDFFLNVDPFKELVR